MGQCEAERLGDPAGLGEGQADELDRAPRILEGEAQRRGGGRARDPKAVAREEPRAVVEAAPDGDEEVMTADPSPTIMRARNRSA
jgi:hypothetical protein